MAEKLIRDIEAAEMLSVSQSTFWRRVKDGTVCQPLRIGRMVRWRVSDIEATIRAAEQARGLA